MIEKDITIRHTIKHTCTVNIARDMKENREGRERNSQYKPITVGISERERF